MIDDGQKNVTAVPLEECDTVCDDCYQQVSPQNNPEYYDRYLAMADRPIYFNTPLLTQIDLDDTEAIRAYVDAELSRKLVEWIDQELRGNAWEPKDKKNESSNTTY